MSSMSPSAGDRRRPAAQPATRPAAQQVRYIGGATGGLGLENGELSRPYYFNPDNRFTQRLAPPDAEYFETYPTGYFVIEPAASSPAGEGTGGTG